MTCWHFKQSGQEQYAGQLGQTYVYDNRHSVRVTAGDSLVYLRKRAEQIMNQLDNLTLVALYARASSDRLGRGPVRRRPVESPPGLRREERLMVACEYMDEAKSGGTAVRPEFCKMIDGGVMH